LLGAGQREGKGRRVGTGGFAVLQSRKGTGRMTRSKRDALRNRKRWFWRKKKGEWDDGKKA